MIITKLLLVRRQAFSKTLKATKTIVPFLLADIGEGITKCEVIEYFVGLNDKIQEFDKVCEVQSDKASVEITSKFTGVVKKLYYTKGQVALVGSALIDVEIEAEERDELVEKNFPGPSVATIEDEFVKEKSLEFPKIKNELQSNNSEIKALATPAVRRIAFENKLDLNTIKGTGKEGRILKEDLLKHNHSTEDTEDTKELTNVQKAMYRTMTNSLQIPHFVYSDEYEVDELLRLKEKFNKLNEPKKVTMLGMLIKTFSMALSQYPILNAHIIKKQDRIYLRNRIEHNVGLAIDTEQGLKVPNIKNVEQKNAIEIAEEINRLKTNGKTLTPADFNKTTITVSNIGSIGGLYFSPVIASFDEQLCIVAIGKVYKKLKMTADKEIVEVNCITMSIAADHRFVDGATVARFSNTYKKMVENINIAFIALK